MIDNTVETKRREPHQIIECRGEVGHDVGVFSCTCFVTSSRTINSPSTTTVKLSSSSGDSNGGGPSLPLLLRLKLPVVLVLRSRPCVPAPMGFQSVQEVRRWCSQMLAEREEHTGQREGTSGEQPFPRHALYLASMKQTVHERRWPRAISKYGRSG